RPSCERAAPSPVRDELALWLGKVSVNNLSAEKLPPDNAVTKGQFKGGSSKAASAQRQPRYAK
ncbi:MAG: hypothetical protein ACXWJ8_10780, partial [Xanthobacteraceae bacterium]